MGTRRNTLLALGAWGTLLAGRGWPGGSAGAAEPATLVPPPAYDPPHSAASDVAVLAGGCFWGVQAVFQHTLGVRNAVSGYAGGDPQRANYQSVSSGRSGHAEAVQVSYDPRLVSYGRLLQIFFAVAHDPTQRAPGAGHRAAPVLVASQRAG